MEGYCRYFSAQLRRMSKLLPAQFLLNMVLGICAGAVAVLFLKSGFLTSGNQKYQVGVVGDMSDSFLGFGYLALQSLDDSRFMVDLIDMDEQEARSECQKERLLAYVKIPEGLVESVESGANDRLITYVLGTGEKGISSIVIEEMTDAISRIVTTTQSAVYGMRKILREYGRADELWEATELLNYRYIDAVLGRNKLCGVEILGIGNGLSVEGYYFCSVLLFFFLLSGISNSLYFTQRSQSICGILQSKGIREAAQVAGEYLAYLCLMAISAIELFFMITVVLKGGIFSIPEWKRMGTEQLFVFMLRLFPAVAVIASMQFLLYELVEGVIGSFMLQFICCISMGYISGFFYPNTFFPKSVQLLGSALPTGVVLDYASGCLLERFSGMIILGMLGYIFSFLGLAVIVRRKRMQGK